MIIYRQWQVYHNGMVVRNVWGWYLFGFIPLYVKVHYSQKSSPGGLFEILGS